MRGIATATTIITTTNSIANGPIAIPGTSNVAIEGRARGIAINADHDFIDIENGIDTEEVRHVDHAWRIPRADVAVS